jgi:tRNA(fMet)-specific endonuclease VapC
LLVLDTDHFSEWERRSIAGSRLRARLESSRPPIAVSIVTVEEQMRGWLAEISRQRDLHRQIVPYAKLQRQVEAFADWIVLPWDAGAANTF